MKIEQVYTLVNTATQEVLGESALVEEDLSNVVSVGEQIANMNLYDKFVGALLNRIAKSIFSIRAYTGRAPSVLIDSWEFGSIVQKVHMKLPDAEENESWTLVDGATTELCQFYKPQVSVKLWNQKTTFEIPISIAEEQLKQSFLSGNEMAKFVGMLYQGVENSMTLKFDALIMRTINYAIGKTIQDGTSGVNVIHLVTEYNTNYGASLTSATALYNKDFLRYAVFRMKQVATRMSVYSTLFNLGGTEKHTPRDMLKIVLHETLDAGVSAFLQSDTFHEELVKLPQADVVPFWQGSGTGYALADTSAIDVDVLDESGTKQHVQEDYIVGVMFDKEALGVTGYNRRTPSFWVPKSEFINYWYKEDAGYFVDSNENVAVFLAD